MKVFWNPVSLTTATELAETSGVEEILLPMDAIREIEGILRSSAGFLPPSGRKFRDWEVGLLERFEGE